jgi:hypothetical protein
LWSLQLLDGIDQDIWVGREVMNHTYAIEVKYHQRSESVFVDRFGKKRDQPATRFRTPRERRIQQIQSNDHQLLGMLGHDLVGKKKW